MSSDVDSVQKMGADCLSEPTQKYGLNTLSQSFSEVFDSLIFPGDALSTISLPQQVGTSSSAESCAIADDTVFYHAALEEHILTFAIDRHAKIQKISSPLCRLLKYPKEALLRQSLGILHPHCNKEINFDEVWCQLNNGMKWEGEISLISQDSEQVWLSVTLIPRCIEAGCADSILAVGSNISASKRELCLAHSLVESSLKESQTTTGFLAADGTVLFFNKVALERSAVLFGSIIGKKVWDTPWFEGLAASKAVLEQNITACCSGEEQVFQAACMLRGRESQVRIVLRPILDEKGVVHHFFIEAWDISLNLDVQKALERSELKYKALADATQLGFAELDLDKRLVSANKKLVELLGCTSVNELRRKSLIDWVVDEDRPLYEGAFSECVAQKQFQRVELNLLRTDNTPLTVEFTLAKLAIEGQEKFLCFVQNISKRIEDQRRLQQSEEQLVLALAGSDAALWDWTPDGGTDFNQGFDLGRQRILGYERDDLHADMAGWGEQLHPWDRPQALAAFMEVVLGITPVFEQEYRLRHKSGHWVWVLGRGKLMQSDKDGRPLRIAGTIVDITDKKRAEKERQALTDKLRKAEKMEAIGLLSTGVAHDFNNVLASIIGYSDLAKIETSKLPDTRLNHYLDQIINSGERARGLVQKLMNHSRNVALDTNASLMSLAPLTREAVQLVLGTVSRRVQITLDLDESCPLVYIDPILFHQLLINICVNARDAMDNNGHIRIRLFTEYAPKGACASCMKSIEGSRVVLEVADNGSGIPVALQGKIFDPFFTTKKADEGTGIGLASVHRIIHELEGHVSFETSSAKGTTFRLFFSFPDPVANSEE
ncbi:MAG: PAS domain-containing protein [Gammaproteobacteria bacterium]|nr:PAS domain-containing protein [Gammaproteobacteria bacterium]